MLSTRGIDDIQTLINTGISEYRLDSNLIAFLLMINTSLTRGVPPMQSMIELQIRGFVMGPSP